VQGLTAETLFDYSYWATRQLLAKTAEVSRDTFRAPADISYRGLRATLVHALDVERSWRLRLQGEPAEVFDAQLQPETFADIASLAAFWAEDEMVMREWLGTLEEDRMNEVVDLGPDDRFPLWTFLLHIITHSIQQRRDAALILERAGHPPPEIDFLYYADTLA
jgi:uncharacterized damage-inducible protein DinB